MGIKLSMNVRESLQRLDQLKNGLTLTPQHTPDSQPSDLAEQIRKMKKSAFSEGLNSTKAFDACCGRTAHIEVIDALQALRTTVKKFLELETLQSQYIEQLEAQLEKEKYMK